ncbi:MAG: hypothetical protein IJ124_15000 [Clostridia bacterium]|nr:hypothetical protein [Clostridia bacterium]
MRKNSRRIAVGGMMAALATAVLLLGGVVPAATFVGPALAGLMLLPVLAEGGRRMALGAWIAVSALSLMLCADKEAALLFAFLGWYPALKWQLDARLKGWRSVAVKLLLWNACAGAMALMIFFVFRMDQIIAEYRQMSRVMLAAFALLANITLLLYDRTLNIAAALYLRRLRPKLFGK